MSTRLFLYQTDPQSIQWALYQDNHIGEINRGDWQDLSTYIANNQLLDTEVNVVISGRMASFVTTQLSPSQLKYVKKALPFALEDKLAQDPSKVQIHLSQKNKQGQVTAWLTHKDLIASIVENTSEVGLEIVSVVVDVDLIALSSGIQIWVTQDNEMLFYSPDIRYSANKEWLVATAEQFKTPSTISLYVPNDYPEAEILGHQVSSLFEQEVELKRYGNALFYQLIKQSIDIDIRPTQLFTKRTKTNPVVQASIIRTLAASILLALVYISSQLMDARAVTRQLDEYTQSNQRLCKQIFGQQKQCRENLLRREVASLLKQASPTIGSDLTLISLLNVLGEEVNSDIALESIRYDDNRQELLLTAKGADLSVLEQYKGQLLSRKIQVELSATQQTSYSQGNFKIDIGGESK